MVIVRTVVVVAVEIAIQIVLVVMMAIDAVMRWLYGGDGRRPRCPGCGRRYRVGECSRQNCSGDGDATVYRGRRLQNRSGGGD